MRIGREEAAAATPVGGMPSIVTFLANMANNFWLHFLRTNVLARYQFRSNWYMAHMDRYFKPFLEGAQLKKLVELYICCEYN